jgi:hypothetical protein
MAIGTTVVTPETGRPTDTVPTGPGTGIPVGTEDKQILQWDNVNKVARWVNLSTIIRDPLPQDPSVPAVTPPVVSLKDTTLTEPSLGSTAVASFAVQLDKAGVTPVTVSWKTVESTAKAGLDFEAGSGSITFAPGETLKSISVLVLSDTLAEDTEEFGVLITEAKGATVANNLATCKILAAYVPPVVVNPDPTPTGSFIILRDGTRLVDRNGNPIRTR